jgi:hypothetical protein
VPDDQQTRSPAPEDPRTSVERLLGRDLLDESDGLGRPLSRRARQTRRSVEAYLQAGVRPRWMERLVEIDQGVANEKQRLARAYRTLEQQCGRDRALFARRWRAFARAYRFDDLNELIRQHNDWYPIERELPFDPRTGDYVRLHGRSYRRRVLGPDWVLQEFPPPRAGG